MTGSGSDNNIGQQRSQIVAAWRNLGNLGAAVLPDAY